MNEIDRSALQRELCNRLGVAETAEIVGYPIDASILIILKTLLDRLERNNVITLSHAGSQPAK